MFLTGLQRAAVAFSMATVLANTTLAVAAEQNITPMAGTECEAIAKTITRTTGIPLTIKVGVPDFPNDARGNACLMSGRATGLKVEFDDMEKKVNAVFAGWTPMHRHDSWWSCNERCGIREGSAARHILA